MNTPPSGKRIVSKSDYVAIQTSRALLRTSALVSVVEVVICLVLAVGLCFSNAGLLGWAGALFFAVMAFRLGRLGGRKLQQIARLEDVAPLTQANAALLPPTQTLVRASASPQAESGVLLRAASTSQDTPEQQLLRATEDAANSVASTATLLPTAQEPAQPQEVMRCAPAQTLDHHEEQLLRASAGVQEA